LFSIFADLGLTSEEKIRAEVGTGVARENAPAAEQVVFS
jgi:hypothetical protein